MLHWPRRSFRSEDEQESGRWLSQGAPDASLRRSARLDPRGCGSIHRSTSATVWVTRIENLMLTSVGSRYVSQTSKNVHRHSAGRPVVVFEPFSSGQLEHSRSRPLYTGRRRAPSSSVCAHVSGSKYTLALTVCHASPARRIICPLAPHLLSPARHLIPKNLCDAMRCDHVNDKLLASADTPLETMSMPCTQTHGMLVTSSGGPSSCSSLPFQSCSRSLYRCHRTSLRLRYCSLGLCFRRCSLQPTRVLPCLRRTKEPRAGVERLRWTSYDPGPPRGYPSLWSAVVCDCELGVLLLDCLTSLVALASDPSWIVFRNVGRPAREVAQATTTKRGPESAMPVSGGAGEASSLCAQVGPEADGWLPKPYVRGGRREGERDRGRGSVRIATRVYRLVC